MLHLIFVLFPYLVLNGISFPLSFKCIHFLAQSKHYFVVCLTGRLLSPPFETVATYSPESFLLFLSLTFFQDGMLKHKNTYEIISPEDIGLLRSNESGIVLGKLRYAETFLSCLLWCCLQTLASLAKHALYSSFSDFFSSFYFF